MEAAQNSVTDKESRRRIVLDSEPVIPIDEVQGNVLLGFNKAYNIQVVLDIDTAPSSEKVSRVIAVKQWLKDTVFPNLTSAENVMKHRAQYRALGFLSYTGPAFVNISFGFNGLFKLLEGTEYEDSLASFDDFSAFRAGASNRAQGLGDRPNEYEFGERQNNDILITIAADGEAKVQEMRDVLVGEAAVQKEGNIFLKIAHEIQGFRGNKADDIFYGHEHFGFQDGLSQPEARGTYEDKVTGQKEFIVRRTIDPLDDRFAEYAKPGFRLLDTGHFLLGQPVRNVPKDTYPAWCKNASYLVYRILAQNVYRFWKMMIDKAKQLDHEQGLQLDTEGLKNLAGDLAAKSVGRWWDGTPLVFGKPLSGLHYPPSAAIASSLMPNKLKSKVQGQEGLKNGFQFVGEERAWPVIRDTGSGPQTVFVKPPGKGSYLGDDTEVACPRGAHIRKIQPRDEFTDIGNPTDTLRHRMIRRGNNFGDRVPDVFDESSQTGSRGLLFIAYVSSIERQFEFVQRQWGNPKNRPKQGGHDMVIGLPSEKKKTLPFNLRNAEESREIPVTLETEDRFAISKGMGYFILPTKPAILEVLCAPLG